MAIDETTNNKLDSIHRIEALDKLIQNTIASLGGPGPTNQFEIEARFEVIEDSNEYTDLCPIVKIIKR